MVKKVSFVVLFVMCCGFASYAAVNAANANLCPNGGFDNTANPTEGWMTDYAWTKNSWYMNNKSRISFLPTYKGKKTVLYMKGGPEVKMETAAMPFDLGTKYTCTVTFQNTGALPHIYCWGYKWKPGVRPYYDKPIHLGDLRGIYKSDFRQHKYQKLGNGWQTATFMWPYDEPSKEAMKSLKYVRYFTVYFVAVKGSGTSVWVDDVTVTAKKDGVKFLTPEQQAAIEKKNAERSERLRKAAKEKYLKEKEYLSKP